ncbi:MAG: Ribosomal-protein-alanine N-acetyltransferase [Bacteroidota bacterium]
MISIQSERLRLIPLDNSMLTRWKTVDREAMEKSLYLVPNRFDLEEFYQQEMNQALVDFWIPQTHKFPFEFCWYTNWEIIYKPSSCSVGGIGFSGLPNNEGVTEIGYVIDQKFRNKGIATEAVKLLIDWAAQDEGLIKVIAETPQENLGSQHVLQKNGFIQTSEKSIFINKEIPLFCWEKKIKK